MIKLFFSILCGIFILYFPFRFGESKMSFNYIKNGYVFKDFISPNSILFIDDTTFFQQRKGDSIKKVFFVYRIYSMDDKFYPNFCKYNIVYNKFDDFYFQYSDTNEKKLNLATYSKATIFFNELDSNRFEDDTIKSILIGENQFDFVIKYGLFPDSVFYFK